MSGTLIQLIVLAGVALFLVLRLRSVLGTRTGFEPTEAASAPDEQRGKLEVIDGGPDRDIADQVDIDSETGQALAEMKFADNDFTVAGFMEGARQAYEMILMAFEEGDKETLETFLSEDVFESFAAVIDDRAEKGLSVEASFAGVREMKIEKAEFDATDSVGEITMKFVGELTSVVKDAGGKIVEGTPDKTKRQRDVWTFARTMGADDPNWELVETGA